MYWYPAYKCVCAPHACLVPLEAGRGCLISLEWSYRQLGAAPWLLGINLGPLKEQAALPTVKPSLWFLY